MRKTTGVPELAKEDAAERVNGVDDWLPCFYLFFTPYPWHVFIPFREKKSRSEQQ